MERYAYLWRILLKYYIFPNDRLAEKLQDMVKCGAHFALSICDNTHGLESEWFGDMLEHLHDQESSNHASRESIRVGCLSY